MFLTSVGAARGMLAMDLSVLTSSLPAVASMPFCPATAKLERVLSIHAVDWVLSHLSFLRMSDIFSAMRKASSRRPSIVSVMSEIDIRRSSLL
ncbi:MAG: hypothetical protein ACLSGF_02305 [Alistipes onderdonkii]